MDEIDFQLESALPDSNIFMNNLSVNTDLSTIELAFIGRVPLTEQANLFGSIALTRWDFQFDTTGTATLDGDTASFRDKSGSLSGTDFSIGIGVEMRFTEALSGQFEVSQYELDDLKIRLIGLGLKYSF